jgi:hypothetical protein
MTARLREWAAPIALGILATTSCTDAESGDSTPGASLIDGGDGTPVEEAPNTEDDDSASSPAAGNADDDTVPTDDDVGDDDALQDDDVSDDDLPDGNDDGDDDTGVVLDDDAGNEGDDDTDDDGSADLDDDGSDDDVDGDPMSDGGSDRSDAAIADDVEDSDDAGVDLDAGGDADASPSMGESPVVIINHPGDGEVRGPCPEDIPFVAMAEDAEDGDLANALVWTSSIDGAVGAGPSFDACLTPGEHTITVSVVDSDGNLGSDSLTLSITDGN